MDEPSQLSQDPMDPSMSALAKLERWLLDFLLPPANGSSAALLRIGLGLVACWQALGVWMNLERFWGPDALVPAAIVAGDRYRWLSPFFLAPESTLVLHAHGVLFVVASVALLVGCWPRLAAIVLALTHASLQLRNPFLLNSGDRLFMIQVALASVAPLGVRWSLGAWWTARRSSTNTAYKPFVSTPPRAWPSRLGERLVALQIGYVYLSSALAKLTQERWRNGWMLRDVLASPVFAERPIWLDSWPLVASLTYGTLLLELAFPLLVWSRRARPWVLACGVAFHLGIELTMAIPIFSSVMIASYAAFLTDEESERLVARICSWRTRRTSRA
jgi:hypothetical protein